MAFLMAPLAQPLAGEGGIKPFFGIDRPYTEEQLKTELARC